MFGKILSSAVKIATIPVDVAEVGLDVLTGGNGDRKELRDVAGLPSDARDFVAKKLKELDD